MSPSLQNNTTHSYMRPSLQNALFCLVLEIDMFKGKNTKKCARLEQKYKNVPMSDFDIESDNDDLDDSAQSLDYPKQYIYQSK